MNRAMGLLGLCARAGKVQSGEQACELAVSRRQVFLILLDREVSLNTQKAFQSVCAHNSIPIRLTDVNALGEAIGKPGRKIAAITDAGLAQKLADMLPASEDGKQAVLIHND